MHADNFFSPFATVLNVKISIEQKNVGKTES